MIVVTGALGFIGSCLIQYLNELGYHDIVAVDDFSKTEKEKNLSGKTITLRVERSEYLTWQKENHLLTQFVFHIGARTDTTEFDTKIFDALNLNYSKEVWNLCVTYGLPMIYASSAATYGAGERGYNDDEKSIPLLKPLNPYGASKQDFDVWALSQKQKPFFWAGFKFFNVYGPNEYHKARMASVIFHSFHQIRKTGEMKLFRSHRPDFKDGEQLRDFVHVKDVVKVLTWFMEHRKHSGIYNLGTGEARSFNDLTRAVYKALSLPEKIEYIDIPEDIRNTYQYYTRAEMQKLRQAGYTEAFYSLESGVDEYVKNYLVPQLYY